MKYSVSPFLVLLFLFRVVPAADHPLLPGYLDYPELTERVQLLSQFDHVQLHSLGTTVGDRQIHQLTIARGDPLSQPAILIVGGMDANGPIGSELAIRLAEKLAADTEALDRLTFYVIPRANPDGLERTFRRPYRSSSGNGRRTDDDRDGILAEDPPDDLDGDGMITSLRVYRTGGAFRADEDDPRLHVAAEPEKGQPGEFDVFSEGIDNDSDESWNEDPGDGVAFNRNFTFKYQPFQAPTGPHAISEIETRAVADFAWDHPHIAVVFCLGAGDNLTQPWKTDSRDRGRIRTSVTREDADYFSYVAEQFQEMTELAAGTAEPLDGSFLAWSYFHYGRWSFGSRGWRIPDQETGKRDKDKSADNGDSPKATDDESAESTDTPDGEEGTAEDAGPPRRPPGRPPRGSFPRGRRPGERRTRPGMPRFGGESASAGPQRSPQEKSRDRTALQWMETQGIDGFTPWTTVAHPDFPELRVDVGGMRPWWRENPPLDLIDQLALDHYAFLQKLATLLPRLEIESLAHESLGHDIYRITVKVANQGYLSTSTDLGASGRLTYPVQVELILPEGAESLAQPLRRRNAAIAGGKSVEHVWLVRVTDPDRAQLSVRAGSKMVGTVTSELALTTPPTGESP